MHLNTTFTQDTIKQASFMKVKVCVQQCKKERNTQLELKVLGKMLIAQRGLLLTPAGMVKQFKLNISSDIKAQRKRQIFSFLQKSVRKWSQKEIQSHTAVVNTVRLFYFTIYACKQEHTLGKVHHLSQHELHKSVIYSTVSSPR